MNIEEIKRAAEASKKEILENGEKYITPEMFEKDVCTVFLQSCRHSFKNPLEVAIDNYVDKLLPDTYKETVKLAVTALRDELPSVSEATIAQGISAGRFDKDNIPLDLMPGKVFVHDFCKRVYNQAHEQMIEKAYYDKFGGER